MARSLFGLLILVIALSQATLVPQWNPLLVSPNLVLVALLVWCALRGTAEGLIWVFGTGLMLDVLSMDRFGTNGLALLIVAVVAGPARRRLFHSGLIFPILLVLLATFVHAFVLNTLRGGAVGTMTVLQALLHALLIPPIYFVVRRMDRWVLEEAV